MSYRIRGRVVRTQRNRIAIPSVFSIRKILPQLVANKHDVNILMAIILVYSAIKIKAKGPALYSILNPETSSDSPSTRS